MVNRIRKILYFIIAALICFFVIYLFSEKRYIIRGFFVSYILCGIIISAALLTGLKLADKLYKRKKLLTAISAAILASVTFLSCFIIYEIKKSLHDEEQFYNLSVDGMDKYEIILYEYNSFRSNSGCLCIKLNDLIYKRIPDTSYSVEAGHSLMDNGNLIIDYEPTTEILTMRYRWKEDSEYNEKAFRV